MKFSKIQMTSFDWRVWLRRCGVTRRAACALGFALLANANAAVGAELWSVQTLPTRTTAGGQEVTVAMALPSAFDTKESAATVRHVLIYPQPGTASLKVANGTTPLALSGIWTRAATQFNAQGVAVAYIDAPSDTDKRGIVARTRAEVRADLSTAAKKLQQTFPGAQLHLAGFGAVAPLLDVAEDIGLVGKVVLSSTALRDSRTSDWSGLRKPVLMLQAPSAQCDPAPYLEAETIAIRSQFTLVKVGYERQENKADCGRNTQHVFVGQETAVVQAVVDWLDGKGAPEVIGYPNPTVAWREQLLTYSVPSTFGTNKLEATLFLPEIKVWGTGPYPVVIWSHGDIELDHSAMRYKTRIREMAVAREFLQLGVAVLMPARRGVGLSEGNYPKNFLAQDGDPTYKARVHTQDVMPALTWLRNRSELDPARILLAGQSAGGYSTMYMASQNPEGVVGAIDFSGGRTDMTSRSTAGYLNQMMVSGFSEFGATTRVPTLWIFAENDSRYTVQTIRASHESFTKAGGKARLLLVAPIEGDGHHVYSKPELWRAALREYLEEIGIVLKK
jgi:dienelactone hydrolase